MSRFEDKRAARSFARQTLEGITPERRASASEAATVLIEAMGEWKRAGLVLAYLPMRTEPDSRFLIEAARSRGKAVLVPRIVGLDIEFVPLGDADVDALPRDGYGIPIPPPEEPAWPLAKLAERPVFCATPGLLFDARRFRLGRGKGYYDRFIRSLRERADRAFFCGFALESLVVQGFPLEPHDEALDAVATERRILRQ
jgi:5-formyltetrahydrofolate cyclo-ligase